MKAAIWFTRLAFAVVFVINVQCALSFVLFPEQFVAAYELEGIAGQAAVSGIGVAFLMWNATYPAFIVAPLKFKVLGWVILIQQAIGLVGESVILARLPQVGHDVLASSIMRFIVFDGVGLVLMALAFTCLLISLKRNVLKYGA